jgi:plastocyanin
MSGQVPPGVASGRPSLRGGLALALAALLAAMVLASCGGAQPKAETTPTSASQSSSPAPMSATVTIASFKFQPDPVVVRKGGSIDWVNQDPDDHTATSDQSSGSWDSGVLHKDGRYTTRFPTVGTFKYHCDLHPFMHGEVRVVD